jgi:hypothetical protein
MNSRIRLAAPALAWALVLGAYATAADFTALANRVPGEANVIVLVDLEAILAAPLAQKEDWAAKIGDAFADGPLLTPPGTKKLALAALLDPTTMNTLWEVGVLELGKPIPMESIARSEHGLVDRIADKPAVRSPVNAYFVQLDANLLGTVAPANRQFASRWIRKKHTLEGAFASDFLRSAVRNAGANAQFVIAIDLEDAASASRAALRIQADEFESLKSRKADAVKIAALVGGLKGITLTANVSDAINGSAVIQFSADPTPLADVARALVQEVLSETGAQVADFKNWPVRVDKQALVFEGPLSTDGLRRLFSICNPPSPITAPVAAAPAADGGAAQPAPGDAAKASQEYFRAVRKIVEKLERQMNTASLADAVAWFTRDARRIDRLPVDNVDPELVAWGSMVSATLTDAAREFEYGRANVRARVAGVSSIYSGKFTEGGQATTDLINEQNQRKQAASEERGKAIDSVNAMMRNITAEMSKIRKTMVDRYKVDF